MERRGNEPINLDNMCTEQNRREGSQRNDMPLHSAEQEQHEGEKKVKQAKNYHYINPTSSDAVQVPIDFTRKIASINNQQLPKRNVCPEENECQQQISQMMIMSAVYHGHQRLLLSE